MERLLGGGRNWRIVTDQTGPLAPAQLRQIGAECIAQREADPDRLIFRVAWNAAGWWDARDTDGYHQPWGSQRWIFGHPAS